MSDENSVPRTTITRKTLVGRLIAGRYRVEALVGEGAMGRVYRAEHVDLAKKVALKVLPPEATASEMIRGRFRREARAAAKIEHPNVCAATDFGMTDDQSFFLVMEYLEGETLEERISRTKGISVARAVDIADQIAAALVRTHALGLVHRDLKPTNIMLVQREDKADFVKVLDFGIARQVGDTDASGRLTEVGETVGTPAYMAPEQVAAEEVDARADLYSLGLILFEMLAGIHVFEGSTRQELMVKHLTEAPPALSVAASHVGVPIRLEDLVTQLLSKDPDDRPPSAEAVRTALREQQPSSAQTQLVGAAEVAETLRRAGKKRSPVRGLGVFLSAVAVVGLAVFGGYSIFSKTDQADPIQEPGMVTNGSAKAPLAAGVVSAVAPPLVPSAVTPGNTPVVDAAPAPPAPVVADALAVDAGPTDASAAAPGAEFEPPIVADPRGMVLLNHNVARGVRNRDAWKIDDRWRADESRVFCHFTADNHHDNLRMIDIVWFKDNVEQARQVLKVGTSRRWRSWTKLELEPTMAGAWRCDLQHELGGTISSRSFTVDPAPTADGSDAGSTAGPDAGSTDAAGGLGD